MAKLELHEWYRQYQKLKAQNPDAILLYRLGDFYETFDDDAKLVAELLDVTLTRKDYAVDKSKPKEEQKLFAPMAGMPYHAVEGYVARLVNMGYRIAIAEQMSETPSSKKDTRPRSVFASGVDHIGKQRGVAHREIVRVITPGTLLDTALLPTNKNNYLAAVIAEKGQIGLAYADLSTGEFAATEFSGERAAVQLEGELVRLQVAEVLIPDDVDLQLPGLSPTTARLTHDLAPMTKDERELLMPHERVARRLEQENAARWTNGQVTPLPAWRWEALTTRDTLLQQFGVQSLAGFGLEQKPLATRAAGAVLQYIHETQRTTAAQITTLRSYTTGAFMFLDPQTRRNLEILEGSGGKAKGALIGVLDRTRTPMGGRLLRRWLSQPLLDLAALRARQAAVAACVDDTLLRAELRRALGEIGDMERAVNRIIQGVSVATPRDLVQLRQALRAIPAVLAAIGDQSAVLGAAEPGMENRGPQPAQNGAAVVRERGKPAPRVLGDNLFGEEEEEAALDAPQSTPGTGEGAAGAASNPPAALLDACADVLALLERALDDDPPALLGTSNYLRCEEGGERPRRVIRPGFDQRMDQLVAANREAQNFIDNLEARERERTGIKSLKVDYNKVFGYYIELPKAQSGQAPKHYERKQTLVNAERYITAELKEYERIVLNAQQQLVELEREAFRRMCEELMAYTDRLRTTAQTLARVDVFAALGEAAVRGRYTRPVLDESTRLQISGGRHPVVEQVLDEAFVPNDTALDTEVEQLLVITGPNMAGKSTVLRQVALIVLMAQVGSFVPAETATIGLVDRIFTRIGAQDDIATGQSTFMVEMTETAALLAQSSRRSLIILDEVGRGTSTYDGMAIARAVVEYIHNEPRLQCRTLFATHYHELTALEHLLPRVQNYHMAAVEQEGHVVFLYELRRGGADRSYGIHVAELAGIPRPVIRRASELLADLERGAGNGNPPPAAQPEPTAAPADHAPAPATDETATDEPQPAPVQPSLFDVAPNPVVEYLKRLNVNELTPIEAMTKLYELQKLAQEPV
jgi:DNA mismatch repair protein MutS